jgi:hypothetical protein
MKRKASCDVARVGGDGADPAACVTAVQFAGEQDVLELAACVGLLGVEGTSAVEVVQLEMAERRGVAGWLAARSTS